MGYEKTRAEMIALEVQWRRLIGEVRVSHHAASDDGGRAWDCMTLQRDCSLDHAEEVAVQLVKVAMETGATLSMHASEYGAGFWMQVISYDVESAVEAVDCEPTLEMAVTA